MPSKIRVLSEKSINEIAAGEVVEGPASIIKELVENAIDAEATEINVEVLGGGHQLIKVVDNGLGMSRDDAVLAFERHATSKIREAEDLKNILTMGFRGEALASIAAVAKVQLETSDGESATKVVIHGGKFLQTSAAARSKGTTLLVQNLFYNTPARKKFQKSASASMQEVIKTMTRLALAHPSVCFHLCSAEKTVFKVRGDSSKEGGKRRAKELLGEEFVRDLKSIEVKNAHFSIFGFIGDVHKTRSNRLSQYLFVNYRPIFAQVISNAVKNAYGTRIAKAEHPVFLLWMEFDSATIDVNVHPQKREVRFQNEEELYCRVKLAVEEALVGSLGSFAKLPKREELSTAFKGQMRLSGFRESDKQPKSFGRSYRSYQCAGKEQGFRQGGTWKKYEADVQQVVEASVEMARSSATTEESSFVKNGSLEIFSVRQHFAFAVEREAFTDADKERAALVLIDLSRVEFSVLHQKLLFTLQEGKPVASERLLIPETIACLPQEERLLLGEIELLSRIGIELKHFGKDTFLLEAVPTFLTVEECKKSIFRLLELPGCDRNAGILVGEILRHRRKKKTYQKEEANHLLKELFLQRDPLYTPSGDRTLCYLSEKQLDELFTKGRVNIS